MSPVMSRVVLRRLALAAAASATALAAAPSVASAESAPRSLPLSDPQSGPLASTRSGHLMPLPIPGGESGDHLVVTVSHAGQADGKYELTCHPGGGSHPDAAAACDKLDSGTRWGKDPFAPVPQGSMCTMQYGGPATAHVTGTWAGRPVDARYDRGDGCEIGRWNALVPLLPEVHG
ncbi:SSI family serine proteinase inhibitor [Streptomyces sp. NPDC058274]|uniref:SSI family serine proteinase inhibitor n=1 Tax=Streptomyces sp. NPDC058274 TaxID=3346416 RepID=UPI0036EAEB4C